MVRRASSAGPVLRAVLLLGGVYAVALVSVRWLAGNVHRAAVIWDAHRTPTFEDLLVLACSVALTLCGAWLVLVCTVVVGDGVVAVLRSSPGRHGPVVRRRAGCPESLRRFLLGCCGLAVSTGLAASPAAADQSERSAPVPAVVSTPLTGLALPDRATGVPQSRPRVVTVREGDTLWSLAERRLPATASAEQIADHWRRIYAANRSRVGHDPDLIHPGTILRLPEPGSTRPGTTEEGNNP